MLANSSHHSELPQNLHLILTLVAEFYDLLNILSSGVGSGVGGSGVGSGVGSGRGGEGGPPGSGAPNSFLAHLKKMITHMNTSKPQNTYPWSPPTPKHLPTPLPRYVEMACVSLLS